MKKLLLLVLITVTVELQAQGQINPCDSISYTITPGANTNLLELNGVISGIPPASISITSWEWQVCDDFACYTSANPGSFIQFTTTDSLKATLKSSALNSSGTRKPPASPEPSFNALSLTSSELPVDLS